MDCFQIQVKFEDDPLMKCLFYCHLRLKFLQKLFLSVFCRL